MQISSSFLDTCGYFQLVDHHGVPKGPPRNFRLISARLDGYNFDFVSLAGGANTFSSHIKHVVPNEIETCGYSLKIH